MLNGYNTIFVKGDLNIHRNTSKDRCVIKQSNRIPEVEVLIKTR